MEKSVRKVIAYFKKRIVEESDPVLYARSIGVDPYAAPVELTRRELPLLTEEEMNEWRAKAFSNLGAKS